MPLDAILHIRNAMPLDRPGDNTARSVRPGQLLVGALETGEIVAIFRDGHCKTEGPPFVHDWLEIQYILGISDALHSIEIDDHRQVLQLMVSGKKRGFPSGTLVAI